MALSYSEVAVLHQASYQPYPLTSTFEATESVPDLAESQSPPAYAADPSVKRHAACDECRQRKLKCSGEPTGCDRCGKQNLTCHYSAQKQMGRPRKRQRTGDSPKDDEVAPLAPQPSHRATGDAAVDPELTEKVVARTNYENICNAPITQSIKRGARAAARKSSSYPALQDPSRSAGNGGSSTSPEDAPRTPPEGMDVMATVFYPTDVASWWPDYSDMTVLPVPVQESLELDKLSSAGATPSTQSTAISNLMHQGDTGSASSILTQLPPVPACPCLPNLYLTLSTLSALSSFPVSSGTVDTLLSAHRTGRAVIYCPVCPSKMQSGSQNVMLSSTLITVLSDHWHRVKNATAKDLRRGFSDAEQDLADVEGEMSAREDLEWRTFGHFLIRAYVFGDAPIPETPGAPASASKPPVLHTSIASEPASTSVYTLTALVDALDRRQKQWHEVEPYAQSQEFPPRLEHDHLHGDAHAQIQGFPRGMTLEDVKAMEADRLASGDRDVGLLCLRLVKHSAMVMKTLDGPVPRVGA